MVAPSHSLQPRTGEMARARMASSLRSVPFKGILSVVIQMLVSFFDSIAPSRQQPSFGMPNGGRCSRRSGFTLLELLVVMGIVVLMMGLMIPAFNSIKGGSDVKTAAYDISGALENARTFALANNTYVWVGFYEEDGSQISPNPNPATNNGGRVIVLVVASKDGTRYSDSMGVPAAFGAGNSSNQVNLTQVINLIKINNIHMAGLNDYTGATVNSPARPLVPYPCQVGDLPSASPNPNNATGAFALTTSSTTGNITTFTYPIPPSATQAATSPQYTFTKIIEFNPQGEASKITENTFAGAGPQSFIEIALQPTHGNVVAPPYAGTNQAAACVQIEGITGEAKIYRQ